MQCSLSELSTLSALAEKWSSSLDLSFLYAKWFSGDVSSEVVPVGKAEITSAGQRDFCLKLLRPKMSQVGAWVYLKLDLQNSHKQHWKYIESMWSIEMMCLLPALLFENAFATCFCKSQIFTRAISPIALLRSGLVLLEAITLDLFVIFLCISIRTYMHKTRLYFTAISLQPHSRLPLPESLVAGEEQRPLLDPLHSSQKAAIFHHCLQDGQNLASRWP